MSVCSVRTSEGKFCCVKHSRENFSVRIDPDKRKLLQEIEVKCGITPAALVRSAIDAVCAVWEAEQFIQLPLEYRVKLPKGEMARRVLQAAGVNARDPLKPVRRCKVKP